MGTEAARWNVPAGARARRLHSPYRSPGWRAAGPTCGHACGGSLCVARLGGAACSREAVTVMALDLNAREARSTTPPPLGPRQHSVCFQGIMIDICFRSKLEFVLISRYI